MRRRQLCQLVFAALRVKVKQAEAKKCTLSERLLSILSWHETQMLASLVASILLFSRAYTSLSCLTFSCTSLFLSCFSPFFSLPMQGFSLPFVPCAFSCFPRHMIHTPAHTKRKVEEAGACNGEPSPSSLFSLLSLSCFRCVDNLLDNSVCLSRFILCFPRTPPWWCLLAALLDRLPFILFFVSLAVFLSLSLPLSPLDRLLFGCPLPARSTRLAADIYNVPYLLPAQYSGSFLFISRARLSHSIVVPSLPIGAAATHVRHCSVPKYAVSAGRTRASSVSHDPRSRRQRAAHVSIRSPAAIATKKW